MKERKLPFTSELWAAPVPLMLGRYVHLRRNTTLPKLESLLFVTTGVVDDSSALAEALSIASKRGIPLSALIVCPPLPDGIGAYLGAYEAGIRQQFTERLKLCAQEVDFDISKVDLSVSLETPSTASDRIVNHAKVNGFDLLIKQAEERENKVGFRARDRALAKTSPCPVWLQHPSRIFKKEARIGVAIDPETIDEASKLLSLRLLRAARNIADHHERRLYVLSCWDYAFEGYLRRNAWAQLPDTEIERIVEGARTKHLNALHQLIEESGIEGTVSIEHLRGLPEDQLPEAVGELGVDILVMGTAARTGVKGWLLGNTSDDVMQRLACSVVVLSPKQDAECTTT